eukprot:TRINITY_DN77_c0_g1_i4.p1 TRINITY_DN77_c0_g1~~TRINITY_DN77_c0_g1_i4.p1  ORF type:complete len:171 (+),score=57.21 TRINITY_DN77_c0_g1_i4:21-533(+)
MKQWYQRRVRGGEAVPPVPLEHALQRIDHVMGALIVGTARKFIGAILFCNNNSSMNPHEFEEYLRTEVETLNETLIQSHKVKRIAVVYTNKNEKFPVHTLERRAFLETKFKMAIDKLYSEKIGNGAANVTPADVASGVVGVAVGVPVKGDAPPVSASAQTPATPAATTAV